MPSSYNFLGMHLERGFEFWSPWVQKNKLSETDITGIKYIFKKRFVILITIPASVRIDAKSCVCVRRHRRLSSISVSNCRLLYLRLWGRSRIHQGYHGSDMSQRCDTETPALTDDNALIGLLYNRSCPTQQCCGLLEISSRSFLRWSSVVKKPWQWLIIGIPSNAIA